MSYNATVYNVMIASPTDVSQERNIIRDIIHEWNSINSMNRNIVLLPIGWETHSSPEMGDTPQNLINKQVLEKSDVLVGVFWTRIGTPTENYPSGSVEEIEKHIVSGKLTMLYFSSLPVTPDSVDQNQYNELKQFRESCKVRSLYESYDSLDDFRNKFYRHLQIKLNEHDMFKQSVPVSLNESNQVKSNVPILTDVAKRLLKEISKDSNGTLIFTKSVTGTHITTNGKNLCNTQEPREIAKWKSAIENLIDEKLIELTGRKGEIYTISDLGYTVADTIEVFPEVEIW